MKTFLIWLGVLYFIQILTIVLTVYFLNRRIKTIGDLAEYLRKPRYPIWMPIIGFIIVILVIIYYIYENLWSKIRRIRIR